MVVVLGHGPDYGLVKIVATPARDYGVLLFFVLSGFLMGTLYLPLESTASSLTQYAISRGARIFPIYFAVVLISFFYYQLIDPNFIYAISGAQLLRLLTFNGSVSVFWSIGPEVQFYAVFLLFWLIYAKSRPAFFAIVPLVAITCLLSVSVWPGIFVLSKLHIFALGVLLAAVRPRALPARALTALHVISVLLLIGIIWSESFSDLIGRNAADDPKLSAFYGSWMRLFMIGLIVFSLSYETKIGAALFANRFMVFLGTISFSLYLLHEPVLYFLDRSGAPSILGRYLATAIMLAAALVISWVSYSVIERPARTFFKRRFPHPDKICIRSRVAAT